MPYIPQSERDRLEYPIRSLEGGINTPGELNYVFSKLIEDFISAKGLKYEQINACIGALECAKLELYRIVAAKYEDKKLAENGSVYNFLE